ncbi:3-keto-disaccharide hydrolase [Thalassoglobus sp.]|uniref:3-keto-disaccharide hydrolase n=1 Tax=Thalassoglobus sp. TaxID=2795869 RepID=UPI003AA93E44
MRQIGCLVAFLVSCSLVQAEEKELPKAFVDGNGPGWRALGEEDFTDVNGDEDTWTYKDGMVFSTGKPIGVNRTIKQYTNFEFVYEWRHRKSGGNSGSFIWVPESALTDLPSNKLPAGGIEIQVLDHGYATQFKERTGKDADWFTTNGDVFAVGKSTMKPFPPLSPNGQRSFPRKNLSKGVDQWNHYYIRAINGEVRLWVNGEEVSGGNECNPKSGYICLEAEGSPIEFRNLRLRELP